MVVRWRRYEDDDHDDHDDDDDDDDVMVTCFVSYNLGMQYEEDAIMDMMVVTWA